VPTQDAHGKVLAATKKPRRESAHEPGDCPEEDFMRSLVDPICPKDGVAHRERSRGNTGKDRATPAVMPTAWPSRTSGSPARLDGGWHSPPRLA
jgi:hypothetical protein